MEKKTLQVELEIPFCKGHCVFCHDACLGQNVGYLHRYLRALEKEIKGAAGELEEYEIEQVILHCDGLSLIGPGALDGFLQKIREMLPGKNARWAVSLLPDDWTEELLHVLFSRCHTDAVCLRILAFSKQDLAALHAPFTENLVQHVLKDASLRGKVFLAQTEWFLELAAGIPGQTLQELKENLRRCLQLQPSGITLRRFHNKRLSLEEQLCYAEETDWASLIGGAQTYLADNGLERVGKSLYFVRPGIRPLQRGEQRPGLDVMGFGLGAFTRIDGISYHNTTDYTLYTEHSDEPDVIAVF